MSTYIDKVRFIEQYVVSAITSDNMEVKYSQMSGNQIKIAEIQIKDALDRANIAWEALESIKRIPSNYDVNPELRYLFERVVI